MRGGETLGSSRPASSSETRRTRKAAEGGLHVARLSSSSDDEILPAVFSDIMTIPLIDVTCYSESVRTDETTEEVRSYCDSWRPTAGLRDDQLVDQIVADGIDILVDLAGTRPGIVFRSWRFDLLRFRQHFWDIPTRPDSAESTIC